MKGRNSELRTLERTIAAARPTRLALVGPGGSGKSMLAAALGHRLRSAFGGRIDWFRSAAWGFYTLSEMLALRFGTGLGEGRVERLQKFLARGPERLIVLDNHEDDAAMARLLNAFADSRATFLITARRCLLGGVLIFPVVAPLVTAGRSAFPRVAALTRLLRWNPLALDIADSIVGSRAASAAALREFLRANGVGRVRALAHEDDSPEISLLIDWAWQRLSADARRALGVLAHVEGDHMDAESLGKLARVAKLGPALAQLERWHLVQEPLRGRYALHAVVRYSVARRTKPAAERVFEHYVSLLERHPERLELEQSQLFAAMEHAYRKSDMNALLRVNALAQRLEAAPE
ncbi:MAG TPA: ATP-binding protein [Gammaproteobacteria bacterium]|nr:ATP-binding protein [Gammaproteobacteria bacterium]